MPLPSDAKVVETSNGLVNTLHEIFGPHPGFRPAHAKGVLLKGTFTPTEDAKSLSTAPHFNNPSTPAIARFSNSTGIPEIPDTDPNGNPRGFAVRFMLAESPRRVHTDIIAHSVDGFPGTTGEEALDFFNALKNGTISDYLGAHPKALAFVQAPKPIPSSFGKEKYFAVNAFKFIAADGKETFVRYRFVPEAGEDYLDEATLKDKAPNFLFQGVPETLKQGPILFKLTAQVAEEGDVTDDNTVKWPEERKIVELGTIKLESVANDNAAQQKTIIFDPIPRVEGIEASADPLLQVRAGVYLISGKERRAD
ncbi:catalase-like domain-containing protein [Pseudomassariella vexata]|uniref:Catalase-like domain-containing protein n=1 Tax=Pseudomassariella vexata TaxID=1141098 RepID=A0A1Y2DKI2_9PEZI|nr:catalase-like domain-containing protein [Pseudomassariella vexata]ORY59636.1 catalase-like domain-containing protein [Pseudomassariella vexata]